jgi:predicted dienelactone hydrolase
MRAARRKYMCDYTRKRRSKANLPPSPEEEEEVDATAPPVPAPSPPEQDEEVMEAGDILKTLASSYETQSCRLHPPAATTAVHVIGHGIGGTNFLDIMARLAKMQDRWVSDDRPVCHHPILRPVKSVMAKRSTYVDVTYYREFLT